MHKFIRKNEHLSKHSMPNQAIPSQKKNKINAICQMKGMLRTYQSLGMELVQAEIPINRIINMRYAFKNIKYILG
jgi:hypothetical protein